jgi:hypothetical protein
MRRTFLRTRENVKPSQDYLGATRAVPIGQLVGTPRKGQMYGNADHLGQRARRGSSMQQVFVPVLDAPMIRRGCGQAGQGETWGQHVLAEARVGIFRIERVNEQSIVRFDRGTQVTRVGPRGR